MTFDILSIWCDIHLSHQKLYIKLNLMPIWMKSWKWTFFYYYILRFWVCSEYFMIGPMFLSRYIDQIQIDTDCRGMYWKMNLYCPNLKTWMSINEVVNPCLEYLILYYQFPCFDVHICCLTQIFRTLCLADVNKAIKYERPDDCFNKAIKSLMEKSLLLDITRCLLLLKFPI